MRAHITWVRQVDGDHLDFMLDVFEVLVPEYFVFKNHLVTGLLLDDLTETIEIRVIQITV